MRAISTSSLCSAIEQSQTVDWKYYVGYANGTVSRTNSSVPTWIDLDDNGVGLPNSFVTDIAVAVNIASRVFAAYFLIQALLAGILARRRGS